jgi:sugar lactone lactonase YvrE
MLLLHFSDFFPPPLAGEPTVEVLYSTKAIIGEGPFYEQGTNQLLWVDINGYTVNFLNLDTKQNRWELALPRMYRQVEIY